MLPRWKKGFPMISSQAAAPYLGGAMNTILVVDDEPAIRNLERAILKSAGYRVVTAANGQEALEVIRDVEPSVIVLDMQMPQMDGRELFRRLSVQGCRPPVLVVTSENASAAKHELGADGCLDKPFSPEQLITRVEELAGEGRQLVSSR